MLSSQENLKQKSYSNHQTSTNTLHSKFTPSENQYGYSQEKSSPEKEYQTYHKSPSAHYVPEVKPQVKQIVLDENKHNYSSYKSPEYGRSPALSSHHKENIGYENYNNNSLLSPSNGIVREPYMKIARLEQEVDDYRQKCVQYQEDIKIILSSQPEVELKQKNQEIKDLTEKNSQLYLQLQIKEKELEEQHSNYNSLFTKYQSQSSIISRQLEHSSPSKDHSHSQNHRQSQELSSVISNLTTKQDSLLTDIADLESKINYQNDQIIEEREKYQQLDSLYNTAKIQTDSLTKNAIDLEELIRQLQKALQNTEKENTELKDEMKLLKSGKLQSSMRSSDNNNLLSKSTDRQYLTRDPTPEGKSVQDYPLLYETDTKIHELKQLIKTEPQKSDKFTSSGGEDISQFSIQNSQQQQKKNSHDIHVSFVSNNTDKISQLQQQQLPGYSTNNNSISSTNRTFTEQQKRSNRQQQHVNNYQQYNGNHNEKQDQQQQQLPNQQQQQIQQININIQQQQLQLQQQQQQQQPIISVQQQKLPELQNQQVINLPDTPIQPIQNKISDSPPQIIQKNSSQPPPEKKEIHQSSSQKLPFTSSINSPIINNPNKKVNFVPGSAQPLNQYHKRSNLQYVKKENKGLKQNMSTTQIVQPTQSPRIDTTKYDAVMNMMNNNSQSRQKAFSQGKPALQSTPHFAPGESKITFGQQHNLPLQGGAYYTGKNLQQGFKGSRIASELKFINMSQSKIGINRQNTSTFPSQQYLQDEIKESARVVNTDAADNNHSQSFDSRATAQILQNYTLLQQVSSPHNNSQIQFRK